MIAGIKADPELGALEQHEVASLICRDMDMKDLAIIV